MHPCILNSFPPTGCPLDAHCYAAVAPLRCLLLQGAGSRAVLGLQSHLQLRHNTAVYRGLQRRAAAFIRDTVRLASCTEEDVLRMAAILDTNAFDISRGDRQVSCRVPRLVIRTAALDAFRGLPFLSRSHVIA